MRPYPAKIRQFEVEAKTAIAEIGAALISVKKILGHGHFGKWLKGEVGYTERTAQNYMNVAKAFGSKPEIVSHLPKTTTYQLAALPDAERVEILALIVNPKEPPVKAIKDKIANHKWAEKRAEMERAEQEAEAARDAKRSPAARKARKAKKEKEEVERKARMERQEREEAKTKRLIAELATKMGPDMVGDLVAILKRRSSWAMQEELQSFLIAHKEADQIVDNEIDELLIDHVA